jgi:hypothetical protein
MRRRLLLLALGCLISNDVPGADKPIPLILERETTLRVGELAVLQIPPDRRYSHFDGNTGVFGNALMLVRRSKHTALYRAVRPGQGTITIGPHVPKGECISCATLHYFINVVAQK